MHTIQQLRNMPDAEREALVLALSEEEFEALRDAQEKAESERIERMEALAESVAKMRSEAIDGRKSSGIEEEWTEDEEFYEGIDDVNRGENRSSWRSKPPGLVIPDGDDDGANTGSTIFLNITRPYCDAAGASLSDMLIPTDDASWQITNTPVPELSRIADGVIPDQMRADIRRQIGGAEDSATEVESSMVRQAQEILESAKRAAEKAQLRIMDWHVECQYHAEMRKIIEDSARTGTGVVKGPIPRKKTHKVFRDGAFIEHEEIKPVTKRIDYWNLFPDPACGDDIQNGSYIFERDDITRKQLRQLIGNKDYDEDQIRAALEEGPKVAEPVYKKSDDMKDRPNKGLFEIWYFYGEVMKEDMEAAGCECEEDAAPAHIVMVNNRPIKVTLNHMDDGDFPYDVMVWQTRRGMPWGIGVSRQIRTPQRMVNGAARNMMDNAGIAGGPMMAYRQGVLEPDNGIVEMAARKIWIAGEDADDVDLSKALTYYKIDMMVNELMAIINLGLKMAEDVTGLPMIMQGQMGSQKLETLGQTEILGNNANIVRRRIARLFDDRVTEPHVRRYYRYLLQYGEHDDEKGEFVIDARGSSNLVERATQKEKALDLLRLSENPVYNIDPKKCAVEYLRSQKLDPKSFEYDDDKWKQMVENMMRPPQDSRMQLAELNAQIAQAKLESSEKVKVLEQQTKERMQEREHQFEAGIRQFEAQVEQQLAEFNKIGDRDMLIDKLKTELNQTVMKLTTTKQLAGMHATADQLPKPPVEPPGKAQPGMSFQQ